MDQKTSLSILLVSYKGNQSKSFKNITNKLRRRASEKEIILNFTLFTLVIHGHCLKPRNHEAEVEPYGLVRQRQQWKDLETAGLTSEQQARNGEQNFISTFVCTLISGCIWKEIQKGGCSPLKKPGKVGTTAPLHSRVLAILLLPQYLFRWEAHFQKADFSVRSQFTFFLLYPDRYDVCVFASIGSGEGLQVSI